MLIKGFRIVWVKVQVKKEKHFYLNIPISLYAFEELFDCIVDLLEFMSFFVPVKTVTKSTPVSIHTVKILVKAIAELFDSLSGSEPYDLVDVEVEDVKVSIKIR